MQTVCNTYWDAGKGNLTAQNTRKPFGGRGSARTLLRELTALPQTPKLMGRGWLSPPQEPHPPLSALRVSPLLPHSKISSDAVDCTVHSLAIYGTFLWLNFMWCGDQIVSDLAADPKSWMNTCSVLFTNPQPVSLFVFQLFMWSCLSWFLAAVDQWLLHFLFVRSWLGFLTFQFRDISREHADSYKIMLKNAK